MKFLYTVLLLGMIGILYLPSSLSASKATNEIFYAQKQLTAHLKEANLNEVLLAVAKVAKVEFTINKAIADRKVSVQFDKLPLEKGIRKILRPLNHSMIFNSSGRLKKIIILESGSKSIKETISEDHNSSLSIALNQQDFDPSLGPAGRLEEELIESSAGGGPGPEGEMHIPVAGIDYDPAIGPTGRLEEALPESVTGPGGPEDEMGVFSEGEEFDPSLGPTGQPEEDLHESTTDPGGSLQEGQGPASSMDNVPSSSSNSQ
jgi:hypothetical protein